MMRLSRLIEDLAYSSDNKAQTINFRDKYKQTFSIDLSNGASCPGKGLAAENEQRSSTMMF